VHRRNGAFHGNHRRTVQDGDQHNPLKPRIAPRRRYCVTQRVVVMCRVTCPSAYTSPATSVFSSTWQVRSGGGGGATGGGGGGLAQPASKTAKKANGNTRFPRLFIGRPAMNGRATSATQPTTEDLATHSL
jgi:hypothetical protein